MIARILCSFAAGLLTLPSVSFAEKIMPATCQEQGIDYFGKVYWKASEFPLSLYILDSTPEGIADDTTLAAATWNNFLGFTAFRVYTISDAEAQMVYSFPTRNGIPVRMELLDKGILAATYIQAKPIDGFAGVREILINTIYADDFNNYHRTMVHELGHALGLEHDDHPSSVMYGQVTKRSASHWYIEAIDRHYIRSMAFGKEHECR